MDKRVIFRSILAIAICLFAAFACGRGYDYYCRKAEQENHDRIKGFIDSELRFEEDALNDELAVFESWLAAPHVSDADIGLLYERISNIYKFQGRTIDYYEALGCALYYLDKGGDVETAANIYADLANYYVTNFAFDRAQEMMDAIYAMTDIEKMEDLQVQSYVYRMQGILDCHNGKYEEALNHLEISRSIVDLSHTGIWETPYYGMIDVRCAQVYFEAGRYDEAQKIVDDYAGNAMFTDTMYASILARDFIIPYYEVACRLAAMGQDQAVAQPLIDEFVRCCETFDFRKSELNTLLYLLENTPPATHEEEEAVYDMIDDAYLILTDMQSDEYSGLISEQMKEAIREMADADAKLIEHRKRTTRVVLYTAVVLVILILLAITFYQGTVDGLCRIKNRKAFNRELWYLKKSHVQYGIVMMDIDDFKHINDTYGHLMGDAVLQSLGGILRSVENKRVKCFRYGGEEFVIISLNPDVEAIVAVGELIRKEFEAQKWEFGERVTLSLGVATDTSAADIVNIADQNLYYSKEHGKNTLTYCKDGVTITTRG